MAQIVGLDTREKLTVQVTQGTAHGDLHLSLQMTEEGRTDTVTVFLGFEPADAARAAAALEKAAAQAREIAGPSSPAETAARLGR